MQSLHDTTFIYLLRIMWKKENEKAVTKLLNCLYLILKTFQFQSCNHFSYIRFTTQVQGSFKHRFTFDSAVRKQFFILRFRLWLCFQHCCGPIRDCLLLILFSASPCLSLFNNSYDPVLPQSKYPIFKFLCLGRVFFEITTGLRLRENILF